SFGGGGGVTRFNETFYVALVDHAGAGVHERGDRGEGILNPVHGQGRERVVMQVVEHSGSQVGHGERLLADGGGDVALLHGFQRARVGVHGHDQFAGDVLAAQHFSDFGPVDCGEAGEGVDLGAFFHHFHGAVENHAGIAVFVDHLGDFDLRVFGEDIGVATQAVFQIGLLGYGEDDHVALAGETFGDYARTHDAGLIVVGADKEQALAVGSVRVDGDHRHALGDGGIDILVQEARGTGGDQDAGGLLLEDVLELLVLGLGVVGLGAYEFGMDMHLGGGAVETGGGFLPIGDFGISGNEKVLFLHVVLRAAAAHERH